MESIVAEYTSFKVQWLKEMHAPSLTFTILRSAHTVYWCALCGSQNKQQLFPYTALTLSDPTSDLVRQYDFPVLLRCRKTSDTVFVAFVRPLSETVRRFSSCSTKFSQQIAQVVLFLFLHVFLF
jgi:hypothetical protein